MVKKFTYKGYTINIYPVDLKKNTGFMANVNKDKTVRFYGLTIDGLKQKIINEINKVI
jgi:hypothetical protein